MFIDTHAHIYTEDFDDDLDLMLQRAGEAGIDEIYMPNIDQHSIYRLMRVAKAYPQCLPMMGLHPCHVDDQYKSQLDIVEKWLSEYTFCGIGEIGIDLYWEKKFQDQQIKAFRHQIQLAAESKLPFVIHSRESLDLTIDIVSELQKGQLTGIFHCFNGSIDQAKKIIDLGFYLGIGGVITYKNAGVDKVVSSLPIDHMVLETDAPYLSPVPYRGKRNESGYIALIAEKLSEIKEMSLGDIAIKTTENAKKVFSDTPK
ncbi:MAG: TatD family hydrolase [Saprospiraceae bacterium]